VVALELPTRLCRDLGIDFPILSVGFGFSAGPKLVSAVSKTGGCGVLGTGLPGEEIRRRIARVRRLTNQPFGVNVIIAELEQPNIPRRTGHSSARRSRQRSRSVSRCSCCSSTL